MDKIEYVGKKKKRNSNSAIKFIIVIIIAFLIGASLMYLYSMNNPKIITKKRRLVLKQDLAFVFKITLLILQQHFTII